MVEIDAPYGSLKRDDRPAYPVDPGSKGSPHPGRREPRSRLSQPRGDGQANDRTALHGRPIECSTAAEAVAWATTSRGRAGLCPFLSGPPQSSDKRAARSGPADLSQTLHVKIVQEWTATLTGPFDWGDWPLDRYVFGEAFHQSLEHQESLDNAAWVCAMVACGLAHGFPELDVQPRSVGPGGVQLVRKDGAKGYRCTVVSGRGTGSHLDFWRLPSGVIDFAAFTGMRLLRSPNTESGQTAC